MDKLWDIEKRVPFDAKDVSQSGDDEGVFSGRAAAFGNVDYDNEIIEKGAFQDSIDTKGGTFPLLDSHDTKTPIGFVRVSEDTHGLNVDEGHINLGTPDGARVFSHLKFAKERNASIYNGMSIGGLVTKDSIAKDGIRKVQGIELMEISIVTFPANTNTHFSSLKSAARKMEVKSLSGASPEEASGRLSTFFKGNRRAKQQFERFIIDDEPIIDVVDGRIVIVPEAVFRIAAKHFDTCVTEESNDHRATLSECYRRMDRSPPWTPADLEDMHRHLKDMEAPEKGEENVSTEAEALGLIDSWAVGNHNSEDSSKSSESVIKGWKFLR